MATWTFPPLSKAEFAQLKEFLMLKGQHTITIPYFVGPGPKKEMVVENDAGEGRVILHLEDCEITVGTTDLYWMAKAMYEGDFIHDRKTPPTRFCGA